MFGALRAKLIKGCVCLQDTGCCGYEEYDSEIEGDCGGVRDDGDDGGM